MTTRPCIIAGHDLWREIFNHASDPMKLLCERLGCTMVTAPDDDPHRSPGPDMSFEEPSALTGTYVVRWTEGSNADKFDETAKYQRVADLDLENEDFRDLERYHTPELVAEFGRYALYRAFRRWQVRANHEEGLSMWNFPTEKEARTFLASKS